jgi:hypothetical protein
MELSTGCDLLVGHITTHLRAHLRGPVGEGRCIDGCPDTLCPLRSAVLTIVRVFLTDGLSGARFFAVSFSLILRFVFSFIIIRWLWNRLIFRWCLHRLGTITPICIGLGARAA